MQDVRGSVFPTDTMSLSANPNFYTKAEASGKHGRFTFVLARVPDPNYRGDAPMSPEAPRVLWFGQAR